MSTFHSPNFPSAGAPIPFYAEHPRLNRVLATRQSKMATVSEYARASVVDVQSVLGDLGRGAAAGCLAFEPVGTELFVLTAPQGRPMRAGVPEIEPNMWEFLRRGRDRLEAYPLWQTLRGMEDAGWEVEVQPHRIMSTLSPVSSPPVAGVVMNQKVYPLVVRASNDQLSSPTGPLATLAQAGALLVAIVVDSGGLDGASTAVRRLWMSGFATGTVALILEGPRYNPVQLSPGDASVAPRSVTLSGREPEGF